MRKFALLLIAVATTLVGCRKDFDTVPSSGNLEFSKTTVYLDTIFTGISSSTYRLKVYNRSNSDISIPAIRLEKGDASKYRIMVDGMTGVGGQGKYFPNVELLAKDSLFIFIEATANIADTEADFTYNDRILFDSSNGQQTVNLVTLIQDAHFIFPNRDLDGMKEILTLAGSTEPSGIEGHTLTTPEELNWTENKPYVIYGYAHVPTGSTLHIAEGTKVHFHDGAGIIVDQGANLVIDGNPSTYDLEGNVVDDNEVTFEGDRLEPRFSDTPGQWAAVLILSTSGNSIDHLTLKNSTIGLYLPGDGPQGFKPQVAITNSQIFNSSNYGIYGNFANISAENLAINLAGQACLAGFEGGDYTLLHCSLNNDWQSTNQLTATFDNYEVVDNRVGDAFPLTLSLKNSIIYNTNRVGFVIDLKADTTMDLSNITYNLFKFNDFGTTLENIALYDIIREGNTNHNLINESPGFTDANRNRLYLLTTSFAAAKGDPAFAAGFDYFGVQRNNPPDLGAYKAFIPN